MRFTSIIISISLLSCDIPGFIGEDFVGEQIVNVSLVDTVSVDLSSVIFDSLLTTNSQRLLVGHHLDDSLGLTTARAYFRLDEVSATTFPDEDAEYDYAEFEFFYDNYYYYDTIPAVNLSVFALTEELEVNDDDNNLYNVDAFSYDLDSALLSQNILPRPRREEKLTMRVVNDTLVKQIFELSKDQSSFLEDFEELSNGFVLTAELSDPNGAFMGFTKSSKLLIHYEEGGEELEFEVSIGAALSFNQISSERNGTALQDLVTQENSLGSSVTNQASYLQSGVGIALKVSFPGMVNLREVLSSSDLFRADLTLVPKKESYGPNRPISSSFDFYLIDQINRIDQIIAEPPIQLLLDQEFEDQTSMEIEISDYLRFELDRESNNDLSLLLVHKEVGESIDRIYIDDTRFNTELKIYVFDYTL